MTASTSAKAPSVWERYDAWNAGIARELFSGQWGGQPIYLDLEENVLKSIADATGEDGTEDPAEGLVAAVAPTVVPRADGHLLAKHLARLRGWRAGGSQETPPFLAVLAFLSLVAEGMRSDSKFSAANYYDRLADKVGVDHNDKALRLKIKQAFGEESSALWAALNSWLEDNDGQLGLPTAYAFDRRIYVGVPISQALVRETDRLALRDLFVAYRLRPGHALGREDMIRLLKEWLPNSSVSVGLKHLGEHGEALERIADVASVELAAWNGTTRESREAGQPPAGELLLSAVLRRLPRPRLHLDLVVNELTPLPSGRYVPPQDAPVHVQAALVDAGGYLTLEDSNASGVRGFAESPQLSIPDVLYASLVLRQNGAYLRREPRRLVILEYDEEFRRYVETSRAQLGRDNLLLCHESFAGQLEGALGPIARPEFRKWTPDSLSGLPEEWLAFEPVEILGILETESPDLAPLIPLSLTQVSLGGGFPLSSRMTWMRGSPPEVRASSPAERELVATLGTDRVLGGVPREPRELKTFSGSTVISIDEMNLEDGDYRIAVAEPKRNAKTMGTVGFRIRSADHPRPMGGQTALGYEHRDGEIAALSASHSDPDSSAARGALVPAATAHSPERGTVPPRDLRLIGQPASEDEVEGEPTPRTRAGEAPPCLVRGAHHWMLEGGHRSPTQKIGVEGQCKHCGLEAFFPHRRRTSKAGGGRQKAPPPPHEPRRLIAPPIASDVRPELDELLEALSFAGYGSWSTFDALASYVEDSPWFPIEAARLLVALGHIDVALSASTLRPTHWSVSPPVIAVNSDGQGILAGRRSTSLCKRLQEATADAGGEMTIERSPGSIAVIVLKGLRQEALVDVAMRTSTSSTEEIAFSPHPALALANALPKLSELASDLPELSAATNAPIQRFDFEASKWRPADEADLPGAYRFVTQPVRFCARIDDGAGPLVTADSRLAKWLGGAALGLELLAYDPDSKTLACPLGAQLPWLYERAATLASGRPPVQRADGTVTYSGVDASVAEALWSALSPAALQ